MPKCLFLMLVSLSPALAQDSCVDPSTGRIFPLNDSKCIRFTTAATDGRTNLVPGMEIIVWGGSHGFSMPISLHVADGALPNNPPEFGIGIAAPPGYRFQRWDTRGAITFRYIGQPAPPGFCCSFVNSWAFRFRTGGSVTAVFERIPPPPPRLTLEPGIERKGGDYRIFSLGQASPQACQGECARDAACRAFTYVNPKVEGPLPMCHLKSTQPKPAPNKCCTSGIKI